MLFRSLVSWGSMNGITFNVTDVTVTKENSKEAGNFEILNSNYEVIYNYPEDGTKDIEFTIGSTYVVKNYVDKTVDQTPDSGNSDASIGN